MSRREYQKKRDFEETPEPKGSKSASGGKRPRFVIQKHDATSVHYDFRLEVDGVLKSWAVPKGPSTDPRERRLAMPTEDHPVEYRDFEGVIPEGEYGAGAVILWDRGTYRNLRDVSMSRSLSQGQVEVYLHGKKLRGGYALVRTGGPGGPGGSEGRARWLLVKMKDGEADARRNPVSTQPESVKSGRTTEELAEEAERGG